ncbi:hypothetical protein C8R45DRAFT_327288 [Mycena sanguinolenta]|nr:hypothetical protein C8R45DRAFT_327288 [Mycena sanguinolenta]
MVRINNHLLLSPDITEVSRLNTSSTYAPVYSESRNYCSQLLGQGRGFPLYVPTPQTNLPAEYRRGGVAIGDVGRVTPEGSFSFFFNIYLPASHPINAHVPEDFVPLPPCEPADVACFDFEPGNYVSSPAVADVNADFSEFPGGNFVFSCAGPSGAVLCLPHGAHLERLENLESVRRYAAKYAESWYKYINVARGRGLANGNLYLITGCEKAKSWGMATFHDVSLQTNFQLSFRPTRSEDEGYRYRWQGTHCHRKHADSPPDGTLVNQTTFIHGFAISVGERIWEKLFGVEVCQPVDDPSTFLENSGRSFIPYGTQGSSFLRSLFLGNGASSGGKQYSDCITPAPVVDNGIVTDAFPAPEVIHPSQILHECIFREVPQASVVITHDGDWRDVLKDGGMEPLGQTGSELRVIFDRFEILEEDG